MSRRRFLLLTVPVVLLIAAALLVWFGRPRKTVVTVDVSGTKGLPLRGTCEVDGASRDLTGTVPTQFVFDGYRVVYSLTTPEDTGEFRVHASVKGRVYGSSGSGNPPVHGVRGWVRSGWWGAETESPIEVFNKDEQTPWLSTP